VQLAKLTRDLDQLSAADAHIVDSYLRSILKRTAFLAGTGIFALLGLAAIGVAIFWQLEPTLGISGASAAVGVLSLALAVVTAFVSAHVAPGREFELAIELRRSALRTLQDDLSLDEGAVRSPYMMSDMMASAVVVPLLAALLRGIKGFQASKPAAAPSKEVANIG